MMYAFYLSLASYTCRYANTHTVFVHLAMEI